MQTAAETPNPSTPRSEQIAALVGTLFGSGIVLFYYLRALIYPEAHIDFIYRHGSTILIIEFLGLAGTGALYRRFVQQRMGKDSASRDFFFVLCMILFFATSIALATKSWIPSAYLVVSLLARFFFVRSYCKKEIDTTMLIGCAAIAAGSLGTILLIKPLEWLVPFSQEVLDAKPPNSRGSWVETPQSVLSWGILYFLTTIVLQIRVFRRGPFKMNQDRDLHHRVER